MLKYITYNRMLRELFIWLGSSTAELSVPCQRNSWIIGLVNAGLRQGLTRNHTQDAVPANNGGSTEPRGRSASANDQRELIAGQCQRNEVLRLSPSLWESPAQGKYGSIRRMSLPPKETISFNIAESYGGRVFEIGFVGMSDSVNIPKWPVLVRGPYCRGGSCALKYRLVFYNVVKTAAADSGEPERD